MLQIDLERGNKIIMGVIEREVSGMEGDRGEAQRARRMNKNMQLPVVGG